MTLSEYMEKIKQNLYNEVFLKSLCYDQSEKDSGYRSGLRFLGLQRSKETDDTARIMIYGRAIRKPKQEPKSKEIIQVQWSLF
jgi:hypothetical protein